MHDFPKTEVGRSKLFGHPIVSITSETPNLLLESNEQSEENETSLMDAFKIVKRKDNDGEQSAFDRRGIIHKKTKPKASMAAMKSGKTNEMMAKDDEESVLPPKID